MSDPEIVQLDVPVEPKTEIDEKAPEAAAAAPQLTPEDVRVAVTQARAECADQREQAILEEREACARLCEKYGGSMIGRRLAQNIRARGK